MDPKEAVAELRDTLRNWKRCKANGLHRCDPLPYIYAIPVAEALLAALEGKAGKIHCPECGGCLDSHAVYCPLCRSGYPPPADPTTLDGRKVDGGGWKVFREEDGGLRSQIIRGTKSETVALPEKTWLHYRDWEAPSNRSTDTAWNILKTEGDARCWITKRSYDKGHRVIRRVAWRGLKDSAPNYISPLQFEGCIFTAEEIYILPEEGAPVAWEFHYHAPPKDMDLSLWSKTDHWPPGERPPEKGDWIQCGKVDHPDKVLEVKDANLRVYCPAFKKEYTFERRNCRIVRRAADPLRVGDKVSFGSKEGWVVSKSNHPHVRVAVNFSANRLPFVGDSEGYFKSEDLILVAPVYDRPAEKGDC